MSSRRTKRLLPENTRFSSHGFDILINPRTRQNPNGLDLTSAQSRFCQPTGTLFLQKLFQEIIQIFVQPLQQFTVHYHRLIVHKVQVAKRFLVLIHQDERIRLQ